LGKSREAISIKGGEKFVGGTLSKKGKNSFKKGVKGIFDDSKGGGTNEAIKGHREGRGGERGEKKKGKKRESKGRVEREGGAWGQKGGVNTQPKAHWERRKTRARVGRSHGTRKEKVSKKKAKWETMSKVRPGEKKTM